MGRTGKTVKEKNKTKFQSVDKTMS